MSFEVVAAVRQNRAIRLVLIGGVLWACSIDDRIALGPKGAGSGGGSGTELLTPGGGTTASGGGTAGGGGSLAGDAGAEPGGAGLGVQPAGGADGSMAAGAESGGAGGAMAASGEGGGTDAGPASGELPAEPLPPFTGELTTNAARAKLEVGIDRYIVQNNIWAEAGVQRIAYDIANDRANFQVLEQSGVVANGNPVSFPSIYIGRHGDQEGGAMTTSEGDGLPGQVSQILQIRARLTHNAVGRDANAVFECWFAPAPPVGEYFTASAYLSVWLWQPPGRLPIGTLVASNVSIGPEIWNVYEGPRDGVLAISYVLSNGAIEDEDINPMQYIRDAQERGSLDGDLYLTDIIAGFEVWSGGAGLEASVRIAVTAGELP